MERAVSATRRRWIAGATVVAASVLLAACGGEFSRFGGPGGTVATGPQAPAAPAVSGDTLGTGSVRVALLVPQSAPGNAGAIGKALRNAAQLAVNDFRNADIQVIVKDTQGTPGGAQAAAQAAVSEGAQLIIGPLIGSSVAAAAPVARGANVPIIAFSTDVNVAGPGVYLLSFLPQNDIRRIVGYANKSGRRSFGALLPDNAYGNVVEGTFRETTASAGARVVAIERYPGDNAGIASATQRFATSAAGNADAILLPDGSGAVAAVTPVLSAGGVNPQSVKILGSGQWDSPSVRSNPFLQGAWYPAPNPAGWNKFASRYQGTFGSTPPRLATLSYDAVSLAAALTRAPAGNRYTASVLTNPSGFNGIDGIFRFTRNGQNERGLAVLEITSGGGTRVVDPAPSRFGAGS
ncbi:MAG: penicillin-binding protein activator [Rhodobiaceae bacterium]|nr:penicillin-binding protein activator [Rhodobiaceae bacterium]